MLCRTTNKQLCHEVNKATDTCYLKNPTFNDLPELKKYFKYKLILLDENYVDSEKVLCINKDANYQKYIYLQCKKNGFNIVDSMKSFCGKHYFCDKCLDIFSFTLDHACPFRKC